MESLHEQVHLPGLGGYLLKLGVADFLDLLGHFLGGTCMVVLPELGLATALNFLIGLSLFLFPVILDSFLTWGLVSGRRGLNWLVLD